MGSLWLGCEAPFRSTLEARGRHRMHPPRISCRCVAFTLAGAARKRFTEDRLSKAFGLGGTEDERIPNMSIPRWNGHWLPISTPSSPHG